MKPTQWWWLTLQGWEFEEQVQGQYKIENRIHISCQTKCGKHVDARGRPSPGSPGQFTFTLTGQQLPKAYMNCIKKILRLAHIPRRLTMVARRVSKSTNDYYYLSTCHTPTSKHRCKPRPHIHIPASPFIRTEGLFRSLHTFNLQSEVRRRRPKKVTCSKTINRFPCEGFF